MTYAFLDTNHLLHYPLPDKVDWCGCIGAPEATLVIAPVVFRELNRHKDKPESRKLRDRAAKVLKWFDAFIEEPSRRPREGVSLLLLWRDPTLDFGERGLSRDLNDDWLLASIFEFQAEKPAAETVLVTEDRGLKVKAVAQGLTVVRLPEDLRLPDELDPLERKLRETEDELRRLRNALPNLRLVFDDGEEHIRVPLRLPAKVTAEQVAEKIAEVKKKLPRIPESAFVGDPLSSALAGASGDAYNKQIEEFYAEYERYLIQLSEFEERKGTTVILEITLSNSGSSPARDIHIFLRFPDGVEVYDEDSFEAALIEPSEPKAPLERLRAAVQLTIPRVALSAFAQAGMASIHPVEPNVSAWTVKRSDSYEVRAHVKELMHGMIVHLDKLFLLFESREAVKSFSIDYRLLAANLPEKVAGRLHVIVESTGADLAV